MVKTKGKVYDAVVLKLRARGLSPEGIAVSTLCRGSTHLILQRGEVIGTYEHVAKQITLYE